MKYRIKIDEDLSLAQLQDQVKQGGRFLVFPFCISLLFAVTLKRISPAIFVKRGSSISNLVFKYNLITSLFGWWCIPWGPIHSLNSIGINKRGGLDVTEDILLNITEESFKNKEVVLTVTNLLYTKPSKSEVKSFEKAVSSKFKDAYKIQKLVVGEFINIDDGESTYFVVGLAIEGDFEVQSELLKKALYTQFYKRVHFELIDILQESSESDLLIKQGTVIFPAWRK